MRLKGIAFISLLLASSAAFAAGPEFKEGAWKFNSDNCAAGIMADASKWGDGATSGKLAVRYDAAKRQFIELTSSVGFGTGGSKDRKVWVKIDKGDFEDELWVHDANTATLTDYAAVQRLVPAIKHASSRMVFTATTGGGDKQRFRFSVISSAAAINHSERACGKS